jgi:alanine racemase
VPPAEAALCLRIDGAALAANWRWLQQRSGVEAAAMIKADGYGLGAGAVADRLLAAGCRTFAVSTWAEARALPTAVPALLVLHGFTAPDAEAARALPHARPLLSTGAQVRQWRQLFPDRIADAMVDTGMNRLGLAPAELPLLAGMAVDTIHSHLACADTPAHPLNALQLERFRAVVAATPQCRHALANSAAICTGAAAGLDLVRPGLGIYGGRPVPDAPLRPVVRPMARVVQRRTVAAGSAVGYGAQWRPAAEAAVAIVNLGYADGMLRCLGPHLRFRGPQGVTLQVVGRISMDLIAVDLGAAAVGEGDWLELDFDLERLEAAGPLSQYELLTGLSRRYVRLWS